MVGRVRYGQSGCITLQGVLAIVVSEDDLSSHVHPVAELWHCRQVTLSISFGRQNEDWDIVEIALCWSKEWVGNWKVIYLANYRGHYQRWLLLVVITGSESINKFLHNPSSALPLKVKSPEDKHGLGHWTHRSLRIPNYFEGTTPVINIA